MTEGLTRNAGLLARWHEMGAKDRLAIMHSLPPERREQLQAVLTSTQDFPGTTERQFAGYTGWLARLVEAACHPATSGTGTVNLLKEPVRKALAEGHAAIRPAGRPNESAGGLAVRLWQGISHWMDRL